MVDMFILLVQPGGGDDLQGMKKGIVEVADLVVVNKADGALLSTARHTKTDYMHALQLLPTPFDMWCVTYNTQRVRLRSGHIYDANTCPFVVCNSQAAASCVVQLYS